MMTTVPGWAFAVAALGISILTYTVTITLSYSAVVRDIAVIRVTIDERSTASKEEIVRLRDELTKQNESIAALRLTVDQIRGSDRRA